MRKVYYLTATAALVALPLCSASAMAAGDDGVHTLCTVADLGTSGICVASICPDRDVAIERGYDDCLAYSVYIDESSGLPMLSSLRPRGSQYIVKAGQHVIVKTYEPSEFSVVEYDGTKSSVYDDEAYSPMEDVATESFRSEHGLGDGQYIYMLTNMERNGGFGFTHFTGDTMRRGRIYIVSPVVPDDTPTGILSPHGGHAPSASSSGCACTLQGVPVRAPKPGSVFIRDGRKFVFLSAAPAVLAESGAAAETAYPEPDAAAPSNAMTRAAHDIEDGDAVPLLPGHAGNDDGF